MERETGLVNEQIQKSERMIGKLVQMASYLPMKFILDYFISVALPSAILDLGAGETNNGRLVLICLIPMLSSHLLNSLFHTSNYIVRVSNWDKTVLHTFYSLTHISQSFFQCFLNASLLDLLCWIFLSRVIYSTESSLTGTLTPKELSISAHVSQFLDVSVDIYLQSNIVLRRNCSSQRNGCHY